MPFPNALARFNRIATNRVAGTFAGWLPGFAIVHHTGRRSGRQFRTPVNVFRHDDTLVVALTYGADSDWVKNVLASGRCGADLGGNRVTLAGPRLVHDESRRRVPPPVRLVLRMLGVADFLELEVLPRGAQ